MMKGVCCSSIKAIRHSAFNSIVPTSRRHRPCAGGATIESYDAASPENVGLALAGSHGSDDARSAVAKHSPTWNYCNSSFCWRLQPPLVPFSFSESDPVPIFAQWHGIFTRGAEQLTNLTHG